METPFKGVCKLIQHPRLVLCCCAHSLCSGLVQSCTERQHLEENTITGRQGHNLLLSLGSAGSTAVTMGTGTVPPTHQKSFAIL